MLLRGQLLVRQPRPHRARVRLREVEPTAVLDRQHDVVRLAPMPRHQRVHHRLPRCRAAPGAAQRRADLSQLRPVVAPEEPDQPRRVVALQLLVDRRGSPDVVRDDPQRDLSAHAALVVRHG